MKLTKPVPVARVGIIRVANLWCGVALNGACIIPGIFCDWCLKSAYYFTRINDQSACPCGRAYKITMDETVQQKAKEDPMQFNDEDDQGDEPTAKVNKTKKASAALDEKTAKPKEKKPKTKPKKASAMLDEETPKPKEKKPKAKKVRVEVDPANKLVLVDGVTFRDGTMSAIVGAAFRKPKLRAAGVDAIIAKYEDTFAVKDRSLSYVKNARAYVSWYITSMLDSGKIVGA